MTKQHYQANYLAKVPNNEEGNKVIAFLRANLNTESYALRLRGSKPIPSEKGKHRQSVPLEFAQEIRIYVHAKVKDGYSDLMCIGIHTAQENIDSRKTYWKQDAEIKRLSEQMERKDNMLLDNGITITNLKANLKHYKERLPDDTHASNLTTALQEKQIELDKLVQDEYNQDVIADFQRTHAHLTECNNNQRVTIESLRKNIDILKTEVGSYDYDKGVIHQQKKHIAELERALASARFESQTEKVCDALCDMFDNDLHTDTPDNFDDIAEWVCDDLAHRRGLEWTQADIRVSFKRWCEDQR